MTKAAFCKNSICKGKIQMEIKRQERNTFQDTLNYYCELVQCSNNELAEKSGIDASAISRYRKGERTPKKEAVEKLAAGLSQIAEKNDIAFRGESIEKVLVRCLMLDAGKEQKKEIARKLDFIMTKMEISNANVAYCLKYDASYLSKIRNGKRSITNAEEFVSKISDYIARNCISDQRLMEIERIIGSETKLSGPVEERYVAIKNWFFEGGIPEGKKGEINHFMEKMDTFDLNEFIRAIHFDELKVLTLPFKMYGSKSYYGVENMKKGELNFFKGAVTSKSNEYVTMYSEMMLADMAKDQEFNKKWMFGIAMLIKKGVRLKVIHCLDRPFEELLLGLEAWVPIYMTGQVEPWYLPNIHANIFHHLLYTSGTSALTGVYVEGGRNATRYYHTFREEEVRYYRELANQLLIHAKPLMRIFRKEQEEEYQEYLSERFAQKGNRRNICSSLPAYVMSQELLDELLKKNSVAEADGKRIKAKVLQYRQTVEQLLQSQTMYDEVYLNLSETEPEKETFMLGEVFEDAKLFYNNEIYERHIKEMELFAEQHKNYSYGIQKEKGFKNMQIRICEGQYVIISKNHDPIINFAIENPQLRSAIENFRMIQIE